MSTLGRDERAIRAYIRAQEQEDRRQEQLRLDESKPPVGWLKWRVAATSCRFERLTTKAPGFAGGYLLFRSPRGKPLSDMTLSKLIKELGIAAVPHGFRSSFRDWAAERTNTSREVVEAALAHTVRNPTEAAYARSDLFERRRRLMDDWATYLARERRTQDSSRR